MAQVPKIETATLLMIEALQTCLGVLALKSPALQPWRDALVCLQLKHDAEAAAEIAVEAFHNGADPQYRDEAINLIVQVATATLHVGPQVEYLLQLSAESGSSAASFQLGMLLNTRAVSDDDYAEAQRYFTQAAKHLSDPTGQASSLVRACANVLTAGRAAQPLWKRTLGFYEAAAKLNHAGAMFNAALVSCWIKDEGDFEYAARAANWLNLLIAKVDAGDAFIDIDGDDDVQTAYLRAKNQLATLHALDQVEVVDAEMILDEASREKCPTRQQWMKRTGYEHRVRGARVSPKTAAWENWLSILSLLDWHLDSAPEPLGVTAGGADTMLLRFKRQGGSPLVLAVVDHPEISSNGGVSRLRQLASTLQAQNDGPCMAIGSKGLFMSMKSQERISSYTVFIGDLPDSLSLVPIWLGATTDEVAAKLEIGAEQFGDNTDNGNTIAIMANALQSGIELNGTNFPEAIYVNVGEFFNSPVFSAEQAIELGSISSSHELEDAFQVVNAYYLQMAEQKRRYCGLS